MKNIYILSPTDRKLLYSLKTGRICENCQLPIQKLLQFLLLFLLFSISTNAIAQKKKGEFVGIDSLLKAEKYDLAKPRLLNFNKRNPDNALSHFWLARIYKYNFEEMYLHKADALGANYDFGGRTFRESQTAGR